MSFKDNSDYKTYFDDDFCNNNNSYFDDNSTTVEIVNKPTVSRQEKKHTFVENDVENGIVEMHNASCCFYKYSHNLPHSHSVTSRSIQCSLDDFGGLSDCWFKSKLKFSQANSNNHNVSPNEVPRLITNYKPTQHSVLAPKLLDTFSSKPPNLRESKKFIFDSFNSDIFMEKDVRKESKICDDTDHLNFRNTSLEKLVSLNKQENNIEIVEISESSSQLDEISRKINKSMDMGNNATYQFENEMITEPSIEECNFSITSKHTSEDRNSFQKSKVCPKKEVSKINMNTGLSETMKKRTHNLYIAEPINDRNTVRAKYCSTKLIKQRFFLTENSNIELVLQDPSDRRIKATCDKFNCDINVYSKVIKNGYLKNIIVISAPNCDYLKKCVRSLDRNMGWCLASQLS